VDMAYALGWALLARGCYIGWQIRYPIHSNLHYTFLLLFVPEVSHALRLERERIAPLTPWSTTSSATSTHFQPLSFTSLFI
jgi:hypothetical protein